MPRDSDDWVEETTRELPPIMTTAEVVEFLRLSRRQIYRLVALGRIHAVKPTVTGASKLLIPRSEVARYLRSLDPERYQ